MTRDSTTEVGPAPTIHRMDMDLLGPFQPTVESGRAWFPGFARGFRGFRGLFRPERVEHGDCLGMITSYLVGVTCLP